MQLMQQPTTKQQQSSAGSDFSAVSFGGSDFSAVSVSSGATGLPQCPVDLRSVGTAFGAGFGIGFGSSDELPSEEDKVSVSSDESSIFAPGLANVSVTGLGAFFISS